MTGFEEPPQKELSATGRNGDETSDEGASQQRQAQQENPGEETTTRPTPAAPAGQSRRYNAIMTGIMTGSARTPPPQEVSAAGSNTDETSAGGNQGEDTEARQHSVSRLSSDAPVGATLTIPTDPGRRPQGYRLSTEKHPDNAYLFYEDGKKWWRK